MARNASGRKVPLNKEVREIDHPTRRNLLVAVNDINGDVICVQDDVMGYRFGTLLLTLRKDDSVVISGVELDEEAVRALLPYLQNFVKHGHLG